MEIAIFGVGDLGGFLAETFAHEKHSVTLIDSSEASLSRISGMEDVGTICSDLLGWDALSQIENKPNTYFLAVTGSDETNLVACDIAKSLGFKKTLARTSSRLFLKSTHVDFSALFNVDHFLSVEEIVADKLFHAIHHPEATVSHYFMDGAAQLLGFNIPKEPKNLSLPDNVKLACVIRGDELLFTDELKPEDEVFFVGQTDQMRALPLHFGIEKKKISNAVIAGIDFVGPHLITSLQKEGVNLKVIGENSHLCEMLSKEQPQLEILNHSYTDLDFLREEGIANADAYIACSKKTDQNILSSTLAQEAGAECVYSLLNDRTYSHLLKRLGISHIISGKLSIANTILTLLYPGAIVQSISLADNKAKFSEVKVSGSLVGKSVDEISSKYGTVVAHFNGSCVCVPSGDTKLDDGHSIVIISSHDKVLQLEGIA